MADVTINVWFGGQKDNNIVLEKATSLDNLIYINTDTMSFIFKNTSFDVPNNEPDKCFSF